MNIVRVSSKECYLKLSLDDPIKIKESYVDDKELNKNELDKRDKDIYIEWIMEPSEYINFFNSLLFCAENGLFEKKSLKYFKDILDIKEQISTKQNKISISDLLKENNDTHLKKDNISSRNNGQEVAYLFSSKIIFNDKKIILSTIFSENNLVGFSIFFYVKKEKFSKNELNLPLDTNFAIVWLNICKLFLYASKETCGAITVKLEEIKPIVDEIEQQKKLIKESFAFNNEPEIKKDIGVENAYTIIPSKDDKKILINAIKNHDIFNQYNLTFEHCIFGDTISIAMKFTKKICFSYCTFNQIMSFENSEFYEKASFEHVTFEDEITFTSAQFHKGAYFTGSTFEKTASFMETIFDDNAYFDDTTFKDEVSFQIGEFHKNAYFYETTFQKFPTFLQAIFNEDINFTNTELAIEFDEVRNKIKSTYKRRLKEYKNQKRKERPQAYKIANEFRDSFRNIKSLLIEQHNMLDASSYHRVELYCKELELEYRRKEEVKNSKCSMFRFLLNNGKDFIDEIQLYCYRITSDHHTNLLMILNNVIFLIALFGLANLMLIPLNETNTLLFFKINVIEFIVCLIFMSMAIYFIFDIWKISILKPIHLFLAFLFLAVVFILYIVLVSVTFSLCFAILLSIVLLLLLLTYFLITKKNLDFKQGIFALSYLIAVFMLFSNPNSILPILGKLIENKNTETYFLIIGNDKLLCCGGASSTHETLNLIYMLFLFLLLWSLQKTARKNTIVPN